MKAQTLETSTDLRKHLMAKCIEAARNVIEDSGVLNFDANFDCQVEDVYVDRQAETALAQLLGQGNLDAHDLLTDVCVKRTEAGYLLGLAVGCQLGPDFLRMVR